MDIQSKVDKFNNAAFLQCLEEAQESFRWLDPYEFLQIAATGVAFEDMNEYIVELVNREIDGKTCVVHTHIGIADDMSAKIVYKTKPDGTRVYKIIRYAGQYIQQDHDKWADHVKQHKQNIADIEAQIAKLQDDLQSEQYGLEVSETLLREQQALLERYDYDKLYNAFMSAE